MKNHKKQVQNEINGEVLAFKLKEAKILLAINKVDSVLKSYAMNGGKDDWNQYHDLKDRLNNRLKENYFSFCDWHYETFGFNTYKIN